MKTFITITILFILLTMSACAKTIRNDLLVYPDPLPFADIVIQFQDTMGFTSEKRDVAAYRIMFRFDNISADANFDELFVKAILYSDPDRTHEVFDGDWIGGKFESREKYRDFLVGRYVGINLPFKEYYMTVFINDSKLDNLDDSKFIMELKVNPQRIVKDTFLDMF